MDQVRRLLDGTCRSLAFVDFTDESPADCVAPSELAAMLRPRTVTAVHHAQVTDAHPRGAVESMKKRFLDGGQA